MLPFLKNQKESSVSAPVEVEKRKSDDEVEGLDMLETVVKELFNAKTDKERASAFRAAYDLLEQEQGEI